MSAFATLVRPDRVFLWTDGAVCDEDLVLLAIERKCWAVEGQPMAVTGRGPAILPQLFIDRLEADGITPDDILERGEEITGAFFAEHEGYLASMPRQATDLCIVAWSRTMATPIVALRTVEPEADGKLFKFGTEFCAPGIDPKEAKRLRLRLGRVTLDDIDPETYGREVMEAQRRTPGDAKFGFDGLFCVGGHVLQTEISIAGVSHRLIHRWPDKIGERICPVPNAAQSNVVPLQRLGRDQRTGAA